MDKCKCCYLRDEKPCYECSACMGGDDHFRPIHDAQGQRKAIHLTRGEILQSAINKWGADAQMGVLVEECAELIQAVSKIKRGEGARDDWDNFAEELADVQIMIDQMRLIVGPGTVDDWEEHKLSRLERRLDDWGVGAYA